MQTKKLLIMSILAALLVCSAFSVAAAQDQATPTSPRTSDDTVTGIDNSHTPVEGNQSAPGVGDLAPIYEHNGEPAFGLDENQTDPSVPDEEAQLLYANTVADKETTLDYTGIAVVVGGVSAAAIGGAIGAVYFRKTKS